MSGVSKNNDFGKDFGLIHEMMITTRKAGWTRETCVKIQGDEALCRDILALVEGRVAITSIATLSSQHALCQQVYDKYFAQLKVIVPAFADTEGKVAIYVAQSLTCDMIYAAWTFSKWQWYSGNIDAQLDQSREARSSIGSYLVRVENGIEPDSRFLGKSTRTGDLNGSIGITLRERMLLEMMHFEQTGHHLDVRGVTFCSGSRYRDGDVPGVYLLDGGYVDVCRYDLDDSYEAHGVREAVLESL